MRLETRFSPTINVMVNAAKKAAQSLLRDFGELEKLQVVQKSLGDFVSNADTYAEKRIVEELEKSRPGYGFLLEEGGEKKGTDSTHRWIIDPLDGTSNFLHGIPHWCISIALEKTIGDKREIIAGVVYDAVKDELFTAEKGNGAQINLHRLRVSGRSKLDQCLIGTGTPSIKEGENGTDLIQRIAKVSRHVASTRSSGSTALDLCYVAAGRYDAYFRTGFGDWDIAAAELMVSEAGGSVTDFKGAKNHHENRQILATNMHLHSMMTKLVK